MAKADQLVGQELVEQEGEALVWVAFLEELLQAGGQRVLRLEAFLVGPLREQKVEAN